jgi:hypothetical protein
MLTQEETGNHVFATPTMCRAKHKVEKRFTELADKVVLPIIFQHAVRPPPFTSLIQQNEGVRTFPFTSHLQQNEGFAPAEAVVGGARDACSHVHNPRAHDIYSKFANSMKFTMLKVCKY